MNDYEGSIAQQDVNISTEQVISAVVGKNFYTVMYVTSHTVNPTYVDKDTYEAKIDALNIGGDPATFMKDNLASLFAYAEDVGCWIVKPADLNAYKMKAYFTYIEPSYKIDNANQDAWTIKSEMKTITDVLNNVDPAFTALFTDVPYPTTLATVEPKFKELINTFVNGTKYDLSAFIRGSDAQLSFKVNGSNGSSPALYQIGRTLGYLNANGVPVGNSFDMASVKNADVLPSRSIDIDTITTTPILVSKDWEDLNIQYFKPIGNSTGNLASKGGWTLKGKCVVADWIVAYINYVVRVACAEIITVMNTFRSQQTYNKMLAAMSSKIDPFVKLGRLVGFTVTAPEFSKLPALGGSVLTIPNAWEAQYVDNVRSVKISGTLYVEA